MTKLEKKFKDLMYARGLADFEWDNSFEQCQYLRQNGFNSDELKELGYDDDTIIDSLDE